MDGAVGSDVHAVGPAAEVHAPTVGELEGNGPDRRVGEAEGQLGRHRTGCMGRPVAVVEVERLEELRDESPLVPLPEDRPAGHPAAFVLRAELLGDVDQAPAVGRGPGLRRPGLLGGRSGQHLGDELLEGVMDERSPRQRRDLELLLGVLHLLDVEDVVEEIGEGARDPSLDAGRRGDAGGGGRDS